MKAVRLKFFMFVAFPIICCSLKSYSINTEILFQLNNPISFKTMKSSIDSMNKDSRSLFRLALVQDLKLGEAPRISVEYNQKIITFTLHHSEEVYKNPLSIQPDFKALISILGFRPNSVKAMLAEALFSRDQGSVEAAQFVDQAILNELRQDSHKNNFLLEAAVESKISALEKSILQKNQEVSHAQKTAERQLVEYRQRTGVLEHWENQDQKLNDLILANDRASVRKMLQDYLPWPMMNDFEKAAWKTWLDAIENPSEKDVTVSFRGLDYNTDKLQRGQNGEIGLMSTVLTKNQGSYTRRLRSLTINRAKNGYYINSKNLSTALTTQFGNHAAEPTASSFLSFTSDVHVANDFAVLQKVNGKSMGGLIAVKMDSRRLFPNSLTGIAGEKEFLAPLIVFPDEVILFSEDVDDPKEFYDETRAIVEKKLKLGSLEKLLKTNSYDEEGINFYKMLQKKVLNYGKVGSCQRLFAEK